MFSRWPREFNPPPLLSGSTIKRTYVHVSPLVNSGPDCFWCDGLVDGSVLVRMQGWEDLRGVSWTTMFGDSFNYYILSGQRDGGGRGGIGMVFRKTYIWRQFFNYYTLCSQEWGGGEGWYGLPEKPYLETVFKYYIVSGQDGWGEGGGMVSWTKTMLGNSF